MMEIEIITEKEFLPLIPEDMQLFVILDYDGGELPTFDCAGSPESISPIEILYRNEETNKIESADSIFTVEQKKQIFDYAVKTAEQEISDAKHGL